MYDPLGDAKAISVGYTRPFRYLSPILSITPVELPSMTVPRDTLLPLQPTVAIAVRPATDNSFRPLVDPCGDVLSGITAAAVKLQLKRCPNTPSGGLKVRGSQGAFRTI
jgi:hypothetical protein